MSRARAEAAPEALAPAEASAVYAKLSPGPGKEANEVAESQRTRIYEAMIEIVAERGYGAVTVRDIARLARISSRAFYQHFGGKEECFLQTHEMVIRRAAKRIIASQAGEQDWEERLRLALRAFSRELVRDSKAARLALVEVYAAGPPARQQALWAEGIFAAMIRESLERAPDPVVVSPLITRGLVAGVASVARSQVLWSDEFDPDDLGDELTQWVLSRRGHVGESSGPLPEETTQLPASLSKREDEAARAPAGARDLILLATAKLAAAEGHGKLTLSGIRTATGVSRKTLDSHFDGIEDCVVAAAESLAEEAFARAGLAKSSAGSWEEGVHMALAALCQQVAQDPVLAKLCFVEVTAAGQAGLHCSERFMAEVGDLICSGSPGGQSLDDIAIEASTGAILGLITQFVLSGRQQQLPRLATTLASLALASSRPRLVTSSD